VESDTGYTAGLLHNLGTLGLMSAYPDEYSRMLEVSKVC
jgi:HD-like signal output (HDOD) protein